MPQPRTPEVDGNGDGTVATSAIAEVRYRHRARVRGRVRSVRVRPWADSPTLEVVLVDDTGGIAVVFLARRRIGGIRPGTVMTVEGMVGAHQRRLAMLNPIFELESVPGH
jgi:RecG-like helicase